MIGVDFHGGKLLLLPPRPDLCQVCACKHPAGLPHNAQSLFYQYAFSQEHGRAPSWLDAMAHCSDSMKAIWLAGLAENSVDVLGGAVNPAACKVEAV